MTVWSYKCVAAPRKARKGKGHRSVADAFVAAFEAAIAAEAAEGWEYLRTDLVPMEAKHSLLSRTTETHQGVMVFRRPAEAATASETSRRAKPEPARPDPAPHPLRSDDDEAGDIPQLGAARID